MKNQLKAAAIGALLAASMLTGCGGASTTPTSSDASSSGEVASAEVAGETTYSYNYNEGTNTDVELPTYLFGCFGTYSTMMRAYDVDLVLDGNGGCDLTLHGYMVENTEGGSVEVGEAFPFGDGMYGEFTATGSGTYEQDGDSVTVSFDEATYEIPDLGSAYLAQLFASSNAGGGSYAMEGDSYYGEWTSETNPEMLDYFPETTFTLDGETIVGWERADLLVKAEGANASIRFYGDGTAHYEDAENGLSQDLTWTLADGTVTLTMPDGTSAVAAAGEDAEISVNSYTSATEFTTYSQTVSITEDVIAALQ